ncbi:MAG: ATP-binding protein [Rubrivivax sp.]|jgi:nitrogen fixation/metabolism regulation signal transduction histidine kinase|nr:ATP-binding protein [Rubrivivax sp.]
MSLSKGARWAWIISGVAAAGAALVLAFVIAFVTQDGGFYERHFVWLFGFNVAIALTLLAVLAWVATRLISRLRRGKFGSKLLLKLAGIFALVGVLPGLVIYTVSYQFVTRSIEAWFDVKVAGALNAGLGLGKGTLEVLSSELASKSRVAATRIVESTPGALPLTLERVREQIGASEVAIVASSGRVLFAAGGSANADAPSRTAGELLRKLRAGGDATQIEGLDDETLAAGRESPRIAALVLVPRSDLTLATADDRFLLVVQPLARSLALDALAVQAAYSEYQQRALSRDSLRRMYIGTLTLSLILAVFAAVLLAILLGNQLARPLLVLADGVREVAAGNLTAKRVLASDDELAGLTRSFAAMTEQVADARAQVEHTVEQLEAARTRLQTILDTLTPGVIVFDTEGRVDTVNPGATRILRRPISAWHGLTLAELPELGGLAAAVKQRFDLLATAPEPGERDQWQDSFELARQDGATQTLLVRGATLPGGAGLLVFDDISEVISAQRSAAWAEVARRLAHEIKNPLTPIQLSAERLQHRLGHKLEGVDQALLVKSVATIVTQVQAMQTLVNEFRDYARLPSATLVSLDLNALVSDVLVLYGQAVDSGRLVARLAPDAPGIMGDASQLRQVIHNLVQNGLDAVAQRADGRVEIATQVARSETGSIRALRLMVMDNGPGFADNMLKRAFEPYVTSKSKGTGLGLAVVKKIADEHRARVSLANLGEGPGQSPRAAAGSAPGLPVSGARVSLSFSIFAPGVPTGEVQVA